MIKTLTSKAQSVTSAAFIVASFGILSRVFGFVRDRILAGSFGASTELDLYFQAFRIPDLFYQLIVVGTLSASFIPLFTKYYESKKQEEAWRFTNTILNLTLIFFVVLSIVGIVFADPFTHLVAPGFTGEQHVLLARLTRILFLSQIFLCASMVFGSVLQGAKRFLLYSMAPIFYNVGIIFGAIFLVDIFGIEGLAWGVVLGAAFHLLLQVLGVISLGYRYKPVFSLTHKDVRYTAKHMPPRVLALAVNQLNFFAMTIIATTLSVGSVTMLQFAYNLNFFPIGVVAVSYSIAAFPALCAYYEKKEYDSFLTTYSTVVRQMLLFLVPATIVSILLRAQIVRLVVGAGSYDWPATIVTADALGWFAVSFIFQSLVFLFARLYFAKHDTFTPFLVGCFSAAANIVLAFVFSARFGVVGLAVAYSISSFVQAVLLYIGLKFSFGAMKEMLIFRSFFVLVLSALPMAVVIQVLKRVVVQFVSLDTFYGVFLQMLICSVAGLGVYVVFAYLLRSPELHEFLSSMKRRLFLRAKTEEPVMTQPSHE